MENDRKVGNYGNDGNNRQNKYKSYRNRVNKAQKEHKNRLNAEAQEAQEETNRLQRVKVQREIQVTALNKRKQNLNKVKDVEYAVQAPIQARRIKTQANKNALEMMHARRTARAVHGYGNELRNAELSETIRLGVNNDARRANRAALHEHWLANSVEWPQGPADAPQNTFWPRVQAVRNIFRARHRAAVPQEAMQNAMPQEAAELIRRPVNRGHAVVLLENAEAKKAEQTRRATIRSNYATRSAAAHAAYNAQLKQTAQAERQAEQALMQADREARHQLWQQQRPQWNPHKPLKNQMKEVWRNHHAQWQSRWQSRWESRRARKRAMNEASRKSKRARKLPFVVRDIKELWGCDVVVRNKHNNDDSFLFLIEIPEVEIVKDVI